MSNIINVQFLGMIPEIRHGLARSSVISQRVHFHLWLHLLQIPDPHMNPRSMTSIVATVTICNIFLHGCLSWHSPEFLGWFAGTERSTDDGL